MKLLMEVASVERSGPDVRLGLDAYQGPATEEINMGEETTKAMLDAMFSAFTGPAGVTPETQKKIEEAKDRIVKLSGAFSPPKRVVYAYSPTPSMQIRVTLAEYELLGRPSIGTQLSIELLKASEEEFMAKRQSERHKTE